MSSNVIPLNLPKPKLAEDFRNRETHVGRKGDLTVSLVYAQVDRNNEREACMKLEHPSGRRALIPMTGMWRWNEPQFMAELAGRTAKHLYQFVTAYDCHRVLDAVLDFIEDLKNHPPEPGQDRTMDQFLEDCDRDGLQFWVEYNGERKVL